MVRVMAGLAAWAAGTAIAVCVAWLGANVVVSDAGVRSGMPVVNAAVLPPSAGPASSPASSPGRMPSAPLRPVSSSPAARGTPATSAASSVTGPAGPGPSGPVSLASPTPSAGATTVQPPAGVSAYPLAGGRVTLDVSGGSVQLVTAVPDVGYSVQTWSGTGWLRVDFSSGPRVSSLIASWYQHAPAITITN